MKPKFTFWQYPDHQSSSGIERLAQISYALNSSASIRNYFFTLEWLKWQTEAK
jgi:hypothetical protein